MRILPARSRSSRRRSARAASGSCPRGRSRGRRSTRTCSSTSTTTPLRPRLPSSSPKTSPSPPTSSRRSSGSTGRRRWPTARCLMPWMPASAWASTPPAWTPSGRKLRRMTSSSNLAAGSTAARWRTSTSSMASSCPCAPPSWSPAPPSTTSLWSSTPQCSTGGHSAARCWAPRIQLTRPRVPFAPPSSPTGSLWDLTRSPPSARTASMRRRRLWRA
mmetsp:Transcript_9813/g.24250  ORF Transcript_9813/g.24250 Transcript_9813/m.24250 type:complete len:217 (-) Transcript_9813:339-989(-)